MASNVKKRNWAFVLYPESAPPNWLEQLQLTGLQFVVSPLHDKDINADGEPKKPHYHIILVYSGPTSFNVVNSLCKSLGQPIPQALEQIKGYYRYLTHKDNPEKAQYPEQDIKCVNGFNIADFSELTKTEVNHLVLSIQQFIRDNNIIEYCDLIDALADAELNAEYEIAINKTLLFNSYIKSRKFKGYIGIDKQ